MDILSFTLMSIIENACPPRLMIEQVEQRKYEAKEKIQELNHIGIEDVDRLIKQPLAIEGKIHIQIRIQHKLAKNELENHKCDSQLGLESANYPNIEELLEMWKIWRAFIGYYLYLGLFDPILTEIYSL